jgi:hypothetical protein
LRNAKVVFNPLTAPVSYSLLCWMWSSVSSRPTANRTYSSS